LGLARPLDIQLTSSNHDFRHTMYHQDIIGVHRLGENNSNIVLPLVANVFFIVGANILHKLFP
jgi:hypothetical protein